MNLLKFLWSNKSWLALVIVVIAAALIITALYVSNSHRGAKLEKQDIKIEALDGENKILKQNAEARAKTDAEIRLLRRNSEELRDMIAALPMDFKERFRNEQMDHFNYCLGAFFRTGVLPGECGDTAVLSGAR